MALYSTSPNKEESFLPSIDNGPKHKHSAEIGSREKDLCQQRKFPEVMTDTTKTSSKSFARKYSSSNTTFQTKETLKLSGHRKSAKTVTHRKRGCNLHLPPLALTQAQSVKPVESWSRALGLRESFEIPRSFLNKLTDEILKIDRQLKEEAKLQQIRERRIISSEWSESRTPSKLSSSGVTFEHTSRPGFSYFPSLTKTADKRPGSLMPYREPENINQELISQQELEIQKKMKQFKHRHSHLKYKA